MLDCAFIHILLTVDESDTSISEHGKVRVGIYSPMSTHSVTVTDPIFMNVTLA